MQCANNLARFEKNRKKKRENEDDLDASLSGPNFMRNGIIIPMLLIMGFFKVTHLKLYLSAHKV